MERPTDYHTERFKITINKGDVKYYLDFNTPESQEISNIINQNIAGTYINTGLNELKLSEVESRINYGVQFVSNYYVEFIFEVAPEIETNFKAFREALANITNTRTLWEITGGHKNTDNSHMGNYVYRSVVNYGFKGELKEFYSNHEPFYFGESNGSGVFFYPTFILHQANLDEPVVSLYDFQELNFNIFDSTFIANSEEDKADSEIVDYIWKHVNEDKTPDTSKLDNVQFPIVVYSKVTIEQKSRDFDKKYFISNNGIGKKFNEELTKYIGVIKGEEPILTNESIGKMSGEELYLYLRLSARHFVEKQSFDLPELKKVLQISDDKIAVITRELEELKIITGYNGIGGRNILINRLDDLDKILATYNPYYIRKYTLEFSDFSFEYFVLLKELDILIQKMVTKLQTDEVLKARIGEEDLIPTLLEMMAYEFNQIYRIISEGIIQSYSLESAGMALILDGLTQNPSNYLRNTNYEKLIREFQSEMYTSILANLTIASRVKYPLPNTEEEIGEIDESTPPLERLFIPVFLKRVGSPLFDEYTNLLYWFANIIAKADRKVTEDEKTLLKSIFKSLKSSPSLIKDSDFTVSGENEDEEETLESVLEDLDKMIGLNSIKEEIRTFINYVKVQKAREAEGLKKSSLSYHTVFTGNPGTGKTTIARVISKIYKQLGILEKGHVVETDRAGLVAEYVGQTAVKVDNVVKEALDGVLFIDEAYALYQDSDKDYGSEAIAALIKRMEDDRERLVVIVAGYTSPMQVFIESNPGLKSRFSRYLHFPDYTPEELAQIFELFCTQGEYRLTEGARAKLDFILEDAYDRKDDMFGNARFARNLFEKAIEQQANRIAEEPELSREILITITDKDVQPDDMY